MSDDWSTASRQPRLAPSRIAASITARPTPRRRASGTVATLKIPSTGPSTTPNAVPTGRSSPPTLSEIVRPVVRPDPPSDGHAALRKPGQRSIDPSIHVRAVETRARDHVQRRDRDAMAAHRKVWLQHRLRAGNAGHGKE